jgi:hypothetical protein
MLKSGAEAYMYASGHGALVPAIRTGRHVPNERSKGNNYNRPRRRSRPSGLWRHLAH